jgi:hypothetical protein
MPTADFHFAGVTTVDRGEQFLFGIASDIRDQEVKAVVLQGEFFIVLEHGEDSHE